MDNVVFENIIENVKNTDIKLVTTEERRNYLVFEPNYRTTKNFSENLLAIEMRKTQILTNKPVYLGLSILELSKIVIYVFWYDDVKANMKKKQKLLHGYRHGTDMLYGFHCIHKKQMIFVNILQKIILYILGKIF